jgi:anti-anti-sigma factor
MDWHSEQRQNDLIAAPGSPINHINADKFEARLMASVGEASAKGLRLIIDFRSVAYMSSVGLRVLMRVLNEARKSSVEMLIANLGDTMREITVNLGTAVDTKRTAAWDRTNCWSGFGAPAAHCPRG